ncbi:MAG TPA: response regulator transcription factor [Candidatus Limnocylindrales bacterium]
MQPRPPLRVLLADDQPLFRTALATLIDGQPDLAVVGQAEDGLQAVELSRELRPDIAVLDVEMPVMDGLEAARLIREQVPGTRIVMLTVSESDAHLFEALRQGANGYLLKDLRPEHLYDMLRAAGRGETPLSPAVAARLVSEIRARTPVRAVTSATEEAEPVLTRREVEILTLVADGLSNKEIGGRLSITEGTVKNHVHNALEKLGLENRIQAAAYVVRQGWSRRPATAGRSGE